MNTRKRPKGRLRRWAKRALVALVALSVAFTIFLFPSYRSFREAEFDTLAKISEGTFHRAGNTIVYDRTGKKIGATGNEKYYYVPLKNVSKYIVKGYVAKEDNSFYTHSGVSYRGMARAFAMLIINRGRATQGGSTITQQLVKNTLLTREKTFRRKILEFFAAQEVERQYSKAKIMEFYVNSCYYGNGCYGVEGAARYYFNKHASEVTVAEAAMLVATSNLPNVYNPVASYSRATEQKNITVHKMLKNGVITKEQAEEAKKENPEIVKHAEKNNAQSYLMTYAMNEATLKLMKHEGFVFRYSFRSQSDYESYRKDYEKEYYRIRQKVITGGYEIKTSLDIETQKKVQSAIDRGLSFDREKTSGIPALQGSAVVVDSTDGMVVAAVGGRTGSGEYNRAYQAARQPGSAIKPLVDYGPAMDRGKIYAGTVMEDEKTTVRGFSPKNYDGRYHGAVSVREALVRSYNTIALKAFSLTGQKNAMKYLETLQFSTLSYADQNAAAVSIGGFTKGTTVSDMARAYASLARDGKYSENTCIREMSNFEDGVVYRSTTKTTQAYSQDTAFMLSDILQGQFREKYGAGSGLDTKSQHYAAKTGTTNSSKDLWLAGYSKHYTTALWIGYDRPRSVDMKAKKRAEIWTSIMNSVHEGKSPKEFAPPSTVRLRSSSGALKTVGYSSNVYESRPKDMDYASGMTEKKLEKAEEEERERLRIEKASKAIRKFESTKVERYRDISGFEEAYRECLALAEEVTTEKKREEFRTRTENRNTIMQETIKKLQEEHDAYSEDVQARKDSASKLEAQKSLEASARRIRNTRISLVKHYISELNRRELYTSAVDDLAESGTKALAKCANYQEYESLKKSLNSAISRARNLPTYQESTQDPTAENYQTND